MRWNALIFMGWLVPLVPGRPDEAAKLAGRQRREPDRGPVLEVRPDRLQPDRQAAARAAGGERRRGLAGQRRQRRSEEHTSELQSRPHLVCRLLLEKKKKNIAPGQPPAGHECRGPPHAAGHYTVRWCHALADRRSAPNPNSYVKSGIQS